MPELEQLAYSVQAKIEDGMFPEETTLPLRVVHIYTAAGFPYYRRFGGRMEAVKISTAVALKKKANSVAVRGKDAAGEQQVQGMETDQQGQAAHAQQTEWYCDVLAFVVLQYGNGHRSKPLAFVRWYQREEGQDIDPRIAMLKMTPLKVERDQNGGFHRPSGGARHPASGLHSAEPAEAREDQRLSIQPICALETPVRRKGLRARF